MKKEMSILALVFQLCSSLALFLPFVWIEVYLKMGDWGEGFSRHHSSMCNFFSGSQYSIGFIGILTLFTGILSAVLIALFIAKKVNRKIMFVTATPTICLIVAVLIRTLSFYSFSGVERIGLERVGFWEFKFGWLLYIIIGLQIAVSVISILLALDVFKDSLPDKRQKNITQELNEYKSLLDAGTITQEEFDAKKKQLLGM